MNYFIRLIFILLIFCNICGYNAYAQLSNIKFEHYSVDDGLSQGSVNCIFQDKKGFLWLGTQEGLNKYDGYNFTVYQHNPLDTNSLSSNWVYSIDEDNNGNIWIGTQNGINCFNPSNEIFKHYYLKTNKYNDLQEEVYSVLAANDGKIWFKTTQALCRLDNVTGNITRFEHLVDYFVSNKSDKGFPIVEDAEGIWVGSASGLKYFSKKIEQFKSYNYIPDDPNSISNDYITGLTFDNKGNLWIATQNGLDKFDARKKIFVKYFADPDNPSKGPNINNINDVFWGHKNILWVATLGGGLSAYDPQTNEFTHFTHKENSSDAIYSDYLLSLHEDRSLNLWIGSDANGLDKCDLKSSKFNLYRSSKSKFGLHLSSDVIASVFMENDSMLWLGTWENGLDIVNRNTNEVKVITTNSEKNRIAGNNVHAIFADSHGLIWIGTNTGISIYEKKTKKFFDADSYFGITLNEKLLNIRIYNINEDYKGNIWIGTKYGLYRVNIDSKTVNSFYSEQNDSMSICDNSVNCTACDKDGYIWIGTNLGINRYDYKSNKFKRIGFNKFNKPVSRSNRLYYVPSNLYIEHVLEDLYDDNIIWIGTASGLNKYNKKNQTFEYYTVEDNLPNGTIYEIVQDKNGNIWMSTNRGLACFDIKNNKIRAYDKNDGIQGLEFNNGASYIAPSGELFFGGTNGLTSFNPSLQQDNPFLPNVVFTNFEKIDDKGNKVKSSISDTKEIVLNYNDHSLTFNFAALEYTKPKKNSFKYWMEGLNSGWLDIGNRNFVDFGVLAPGEYTLHLKGSNNDLIWNDKEAAIHIIVNPPIFKTFWAYLAYILLVGSIIFFYVRSRTRKLQLANDSLRQKQLASLEIARQKEELSVKNKNITDSINYAKRIQEAMLPSEYLFRKLLPDSFILYKPRDIVSGDFYWITENEGKIFVAAVDCTGHGVPGAFMSIIGFDLLRNITREQNIEDPAEILNHLNLGVSDTFSKQSSDYELKDGMDVALLVIDRVNKQLQYSGAFNPLYIVRDKQVIEIKGNRFSIGKIEGNESRKFDTHFLDYEENDMIYIFSDGYADQLGGPLGKKFKFRRFQHLILSVHSLPLIKQKAFLDETFESWRGQLEQVDDILVIGIRL
jgi:ligand-binding sensor domain-containing protein/serine phosphatase RsbU (regulator of sigma subunit)